MDYDKEQSTEDYDKEQDAKLYDKHAEGLKDDINKFLYPRVKSSLTISEFEEMSIKIHILIMDSFINKEK